MSDGTKTVIVVVIFATWIALVIVIRRRLQEPPRSDIFACTDCGRPAQYATGAPDGVSVTWRCAFCERRIRRGGGGFRPTMRYWRKRLFG